MLNFKKNIWSRRILWIWVAILLPFSSTVDAINLFGPNNYEECVADGKVGRTSAEIGLQMQMCRKKFPLLPKLAKAGTGLINCADYQDKSSIQFIFQTKKVIKVGSKLDFNIIAKNSDFIRFNAEAKDYENKKAVKMNAELEVSEGRLKIVVNYQDGKSPAVTYDFQCIED